MEIAAKQVTPKTMQAARHQSVWRYRNNWVADAARAVGRGG